MARPPAAIPPMSLSHRYIRLQHSQAKAAISDQNFDLFFRPKIVQKGPQGPWGALGALGVRYFPQARALGPVPGPGPCPRPGPWALSQARALGPVQWSPHGPWPLGPPLGPGHWSRALGPVQLNTKSSINSPQMAPNGKQGFSQNPKSLLQFTGQIDVFSERVIARGSICHQF